MKSKVLLLVILPIVFLINSCGIYSFTGGSISAGMKTVSVSLFENVSPLVVPSLSQNFTEALKERIRTQTSLSFLRTDGDAHFEGKITGYSVQPVSIQGGNMPTAAQNRLSITVQVKYVNSIEADKSFDQSFTRYQDFSATTPFASIEQNLIKDISQQLTEDIYNRAFANW
ncbi:LptE family protein [Pseudopedobacter beijingensis]|uniref:LptE family protein n=1 Tax=Pseudopedobacter beijingensis TaxID=1207056 RepID=A0ABW4IB04_9SPHI